MGSMATDLARFLAEAANIPYAAERVAAEAPQHRVRSTQPFYLGKYEVTRAQWQAAMNGDPSKFKESPQHPVEQVSWDDAQLFLAKLNELSGSPPLRFVLPTEAQWEYACRAGTTTAYHFGDAAEQIGQYGWWRQNSGGKTHPVGQLGQNAWGLYDMAGNVREWCSDWIA